MNSFDYIMEELTEKEIGKFKEKEELSTSLIKQAKSKIKEFQKYDKQARDLISKNYEEAVKKKSDTYNEVKSKVESAKRSLEDAIKIYQKIGSPVPVNSGLRNVNVVMYYATLISCYLIIPLVISFPLLMLSNSINEYYEKKWREKYKEYKQINKTNYVEVYDKFSDDLESMLNDFTEKYEKWL